MPSSRDVPAQRISALNALPVRGDGECVVYWMTASRRTGWNYALQHAVAAARRLRRPLLVFEGLRAGHPWASDRLHRFVLAGMADNARACAAAGVTYLPYVEPLPDAGKGLLAALAERACLVVADDHPGFFLPRMLAAAARLPVRVEAVDGNGLLPMRAADRAFVTAQSFRRFLQGKLPLFLRQMPEADPLVGGGLAGARIPPAVARRWPAASPRLLAGDARLLGAMLIDHAVPPVPTQGGQEAAGARLRTWLGHGLERYAEERGHPDLDAASGLSPYLHFGHLGAHRVVAEVLASEAWSPERLARRATGSKEGWWGLSDGAEGFLDELVTWRELAFNAALRLPDHDRYRSLPEWAQRTLATHAADARPRLYDLDAFAAAATHDPLWNAAQTQLLREGRMHNYLRMLWGKKILEWSASPEAALEIMIQLNNRYALDGRDPNSYAGIFWVLGRYDRPWPPERPIFGVVRYMSSANTARKLRLKGYLERYGTGAPEAGRRPA